MKTTIDGIIISDKVIAALNSLYIISPIDCVEHLTAIQDYLTRSLIDSESLEHDALLKDHLGNLINIKDLLSNFIPYEDEQD
jgi:hypothetical protein